MIRKSKILIFQQRNWGISIGSQLAKRFKRDGAQLACLTFKYDSYHRDQKDIYDYVYSHDEMQDDPEKYIGDTKISLKEICNNLEIASVWPYIQSNRNHVKSYKDKYYYGFKQNVSDEDIITYIKCSYKLLQKIFEEFKPDVVILPNFVGIVQIFAYYFSKKYKIKLVAISSIETLNREFHYNIYDVFESKGPLQKKIKKYLNTDSILINKKKSIFYLNLLKKKLYNKAKKINKDFFLKDFKFFITKLIRYFLKKNYLVKNKNKLLFVTADDSHTHIRYILRDFITEQYNKYKSNKLSYYKLEEIKNFVYFPLQFQPEANIDLSAYPFNNQIETARQCAMNLPNDYKLVVKDHPEMHGKRSASYLEKLLRIPNVKLVHYSISGLEYLKKCDFLIAATGTTCWEAALLKKPTILLGKLGTHCLLPNVKTINNYNEIPNIILKFEKDNNFFFNNYDEKLLKIISASRDEIFDLNYSRLWSKGYLSELDMDKIYMKFIKGIDNFY